MILDAVVFLFVPPAPSSIMNRSASTIAAPISVAPSISRSATAMEPSGNTGVALKVATPVIAAVPLISTLPLISIVVAFNSSSVSDTRSRTPSALW